ncbi:hypothetical protein JCGZ_12171 [Jatropha curcas]|uniref:Bidirectional sugar transporter SWEET n=1 Tax=Jatropha curcas TaxID=180498 RepID=A0A067KM49_JATCU|nr:hypothetical protein JCGZ_12171 [Jatropha curcas]
MAFLTHEELSVIFGVLGNVISFMVILAPVPTFHKIYKKKSSEGFQSIPYVVALTSAMLLLYYALLKKHAFLIVGINAFGCVLEVAYIILYLIYAPKKEKMFTLKLILVFNIGAFGLMILLTMLLIKGSQRVNTVGWICAAFSVAVFAAPLSIMMRVVRTRSVEFMPFPLSLFLTLSATTWFLYGLFVKDFFIALPNVLGFLFGIAQMALYMIYKNAKKEDKGATEIKMNKTENFCHENEQCKEMKSAMAHDYEVYEHNDSNENNV